MAPKLEVRLIVMLDIFVLTILFTIKQWVRIKLGGLNSRNQSRSRLRFLDLSRSTFETCRDYPYCQDKIIFFSRSRFLKSRLFNQDLAVSRFLSRLSR